MASHARNVATIVLVVAALAFFAGQLGKILVPDRTSTPDPEPRPGVSTPDATASTTPDATPAGPTAPTDSRAGDQTDPEPTGIEATTPEDRPIVSARRQRASADRSDDQPEPTGESDRAARERPSGTEVAPAPAAKADEKAAPKPKPKPPKKASKEREPPAAEPRSRPEPRQEKPEPEPEPIVDEEEDEQDPNSDTEAPRLVALRFEPNTVQDGELANLVIEATDDMTGIEQINGSLSSPSGTARLGFHVRPEPGTTMMNAQIKIPESAETGVWFVSNLFLKDRASNQTMVRNGSGSVPPSWTLSVQSAAPDSTPPELQRVWLDKTLIEAAEGNRIHVAATDDRSEISVVSGTFKSPSGHAHLGFVAQPQQPGQFVGDIRTPAEAECGDWALVQLQLTDAARNQTNLSNTDPRLADVVFAVSGSADCDGEPPILESFALAPNLLPVAAGGTINVEARARDLDSGVRTIHGRVQGPTVSGQPPQSHSFSLRTQSADDPMAPWTGALTIPAHSATGTWRVVWIRIEDAARNARTYSTNDPLLESAFFEIR